MKCPSCGHEGLSVVTKDFPYTYRGETVLIQNVTGEYCSFCDDMILSGDDLRRVSDESMTLNKRVNATVIDPNFIVSVRKKLKLTQKDANRIFGGDPSAFSRYESGKALPPQPLIQLLRLLDGHPELLKEIESPPPDKVCNTLAYA